MSKKIKSKLFITGKLHTLTGLHIGGNSGGLKIGGADSTVIRNPLNNQPYIPGSSLRGKMRALLERARGQEKSRDTNKAGNQPSTEAIDDTNKREDQTSTGAMDDTKKTEGQTKQTQKLKKEDTPVTDKQELEQTLY